MYIVLVDEDCVAPVEWNNPKRKKIELLLPPVKAVWMKPGKKENKQVLLKQLIC